MYQDPGLKGLGSQVISYPFLYSGYKKYVHVYFLSLTTKTHLGNVFLWSRIRNKHEHTFVTAIREGIKRYFVFKNLSVISTESGCCETGIFRRGAFSEKFSLSNATVRIVISL